MSMVLLALLLQSAQPVDTQTSIDSATKSEFSLTPQAKARLSSPPLEQRKPVSFDLVKGAIVFRATVAGREVWALLDNGASRSFVDLSLAREMDLDPQPVVGGAVSTPGGRSTIYRTKPLVLSIPGQVNIDAPNFAAADLGPTSVGLGRKIEAVIGAELFRVSAVHVFFDEKTFLFSPSGRLKGPYEGNWVSVPIEQVGYQAVIPASVAGKPVRLEFDLGSLGGILIQPAAWRTLALPEREVGRGSSLSGDGQTMVTKTTRVDNISVGSLLISNPRVTVSPWRGEVDGVIGPSSMRLQSLAIDLPAGRLVFRYASERTGPVQP